MPGIGASAERSYAALTGDLVDSRRLRDRGAVQRALRTAIGRLNERLEPDTAATRLALAAGDEVQVLLAKPAAAVEIMVELADAAAPAAIVFGLGFGALATDPDPDPAVVDGPCFHRARAALRLARRRRRWGAAEGFGATEDAALSALLGLLGAVRARWTATQLRYVHAARSAPQREVAARFGVSPSVVSESLKSASFTMVLEGEEAVRQILTRFGSNGELRLSSAFKVNS